jgi:hypothetical protein
MTTMPTRAAANPYSNAVAPLSDLARLRNTGNALSCGASINVCLTLTGLPAFFYNPLKNGGNK